MIDVACMVKTKSGSNCSNVETEMTDAFNFEKEVAKIKVHGFSDLRYVKPHETIV